MSFCRPALLVRLQFLNPKTACVLVIPQPLAGEQLPDVGVSPLQASSSALAAYAALGGAAGAAEAVCDRCLQPVDASVYAANLQRQRGDEAAAAAARSEAEQRVVASQVILLACRLRMSNTYSFVQGRK